jgi:L-histidine N-alpha-methyltransferase
VGSSLFEEICQVPEYYLTRAEREILAARAEAITACFEEPITLAELGSGSSSKTRLLIEAFLLRHRGLRYVPVDISRSALEESALELLERYQALEVRAIASDYHAGLHHVRAERERPKLIAWLGSSIGNLGRAEAASFLRGVRHAMTGRDRMLVGIDLRKDRGVLERAYDDAAGITARFSLNLLERMNRELGAHFDRDGFRHQAVYLEEEGRVEIQLVSLRRQRVSIDDLDLEVEFADGEGIYTENALKYSPEEIDALARAAGLFTEHRWLDAGGRFSLNLLAPEPSQV